MSTSTLINRTFRLHERYGTPDYPVFLPLEVEAVLLNIARDARDATKQDFFNLRVLPAQHALRVTAGPALIVHLERDDRLAHVR